MKRDLAVSLYKKFKHFENPEIIREKIKEHIDKQTLNRHRNTIKNYKNDIQEFENHIVEMSIRIDVMKNVLDGIKETGHKDFEYHFRNVVYSMYGNLQELIEEKRKIDMNYFYSKYWLNEYLNNKKC